MLFRNRAWEAAVFSSPPKNPVSTALLRSITEEQVRNDCRVVIESVDIVIRTKNDATRDSRQALAEERYAHLMTLKPYMTEEQLEMASNATEAMERMERFFDVEEDDEWEEEDAPVPLTDIQISQISAIEEQLHDLKGKLDALEKEIQDDDKSCAVADAAAAIEDALDSLGEALGNPSTTRSP